MGKTAISILSESLQLPPNNEFATEEGHFLTFEGTATVSESLLHSTFIHAISLPPEMFTRQNANDLLSINQSINFIC